MARIGMMYRDLALLVDYDYQPPYMGTREYGMPLEPDEPEDIQINGVYLVCDCRQQTDITAIMSSRDFHEIEHHVLTQIREYQAEQRAERHYETSQAWGQTPP